MNPEYNGKMNENIPIKNHTCNFSFFTVFLILFLFLPLPGLSGESEFQVNKNASSVVVRLSVSSIHTFEGKLEEYKTDLRYNEDEQVVTRADFSFNLSDLKTGIKKRDKKMLKWADHQTYPVARFTKISDSAKAGNRILIGDFEMHGVKKRVNVPYSFSIEEDEFRIDGNCTLDYRDFDLPVIRFLFLKVKPVMKIQLHFKGKIIRE